MRFILLFIPFLVFGEVNKSKLIDCYQIFDQRRGELEAIVGQIEAQRQAFIALKDASMNILNKKEKKINKKLKDINNTLNQIKLQRQANEKLLKQYKKILQEIKNANTSKLVQSYAKMRAGNAAKILQEMDENVSLSILSRLSPKVLSKIFSKMDSVKAAKLSAKLETYIPKVKK